MCSFAYYKVLLPVASTSAAATSKLDLLRLLFSQFLYIQQLLLNCICWDPQTASEYADREVAHLRNSSLNLEELLASPYCHDATWTLAKALQHTIQGECMEPSS